jgi:hypothetical protein
MAEQAFLLDRVQWSPWSQWAVCRGMCRSWLPICLPEISVRSEWITTGLGRPNDDMSPLCMGNEATKKRKVRQNQPAAVK